ncbi:hypothetical protein ScFU1_16700, partial [Streptococcus canis]
QYHQPQLNLKQLSQISRALRQRFMTRLNQL